MNNEEKKQYLHRYQDAKRRAALLLEQIEELRSIKTSPVSICDGMPHGNGTSDLSGYVARLDELLQELEAEREIQMIVFREIKNQIDQVENSNEKEILTRRYILGQNWGKIADEMEYGYRQILRIHGFALKNFVCK